jgi:hypothetical protein
MFGDEPVVAPAADSGGAKEEQDADNHLHPHREHEKLAA